MTTERLDVRLDHERRRKLRQLAADHGAPVSEMVRRLIDSAYEEALKAKRKRAARGLGRLKLEDVPASATLARQLERAHEPGGLH